MSRQAKNKVVKFNKNTSALFLFKFMALCDAFFIKKQALISRNNSHLSPSRFYDQRDRGAFYADPIKNDLLTSFCMYRHYKTRVPMYLKAVCFGLTAFMA